VDAKGEGLGRGHQHQPDRQSWVENGMAPAALTATQLAAGATPNFTRPLCAYPQYARYTAPADDANAARLAASCTCTTPP
jgi:feruloyl esterase